MILNKKNIFLFDAIGAFFSAILSGLILPQFSEQLGLSSQVVYFLAALAVVFMIYSLFCYFLIKEIKSWMLKLIILANTLYCVMSLGMIVLYPTLTKLGLALLSLEIIVIAIVILIERKVFKREFTI